MSLDATGHQLQTNNKTFLGRHWTEHTLLRRYKPADKDLSILSFGCSTGEELLTIRTLFPNASLFGCDIDWHSLQAARALCGQGATIFQSSDKEIMRHGPFDVILCNSVLLRHTSIAAGRARGIAPDLWLQVVASLDASLKPGGILQIINSNIPFRCHPVASNYTPLRSSLILGPNFVDQFDLDGNHLCSGVGGTGWSAVLTRHLAEAGSSLLQWTDLQDVHFQKIGGDPVDALHDEILLNIPAGDCWASGSMTYRPQITPDRRPSTHVEVDLEWKTIGVESVRIERTARRIWFNGTIPWTAKSTIDLTGSPAAALIESAVGKRCSRLSVDALLGSQPARAQSV